MGVRHHRLCRGVGERAGNDLLLWARGLELEAGTAGAAHAHRFPGRRLGQSVVALANEHEHLIAAGCIRRAATGRENSVGMLAIRPGSSVLVELEPAALAFNRANARAR